MKELIQKHKNKEAEMVFNYYHHKTKLSKSAFTLSLSELVNKK